MALECRISGAVNGLICRMDVKLDQDMHLMYAIRSRVLIASVLTGCPWRPWEYISATVRCYVWINARGRNKLHLYIPLFLQKLRYHGTQPTSCGSECQYSSVR